MQTQRSMHLKTGHGVSSSQANRQSRTNQISQTKLKSGFASQTNNGRNYDNFKDITRNYFSNTQEQKRERSLDPVSRPTRDRQYAIDIIEKAKAQGLQSLSNQQKLLILKEANNARSNRIKEIEKGSRTQYGSMNPGLQHRGSSQVQTQTKGWSHYMDKMQQRRMPVAQQMSKTSTGFQYAQKQQRNQNDIQKRTHSGHPSPSYMKPYQPSNPGYMYKDGGMYRETMNVLNNP